MRANLILSILFLALGVLCGFKWYAGRIYVDVSKEPTLFEGFTPENIGTIVIKRPKTDNDNDTDNA